MIRELEYLGMSKNEAQVYSICLRKGTARGFRIAQASSLPTTTVYNTLKKLLKRGLVSLVPHKKGSYYSVNNPKIITKIKEDELETARLLMPVLNQMYMNEASVPRIRHYSELAGIGGLLEEMLDEADELLVLGSVEEELSYFKKYFPKYIDLRVRRKIPVRIIAEDSRTVRELLAKNTKELRKIKIIPATPRVPSIMYIWPERCVVISFAGKVNITSIEDKYIYLLMRRNFDLLWESLGVDDLSKSTSKI